MSANFVKSNCQKVILLLNAYFATDEAFKHSDQVNKEQNANLMTIITRTKANTVAFEEPEVPNFVWNMFFGWLRTRSSETPSVETSRSVVQQIFWINTCNLGKYETLSCIKKYQKPDYGVRLRSSA